MAGRIRSFGSGFLYKVANNMSRLKESDVLPMIIQGGMGVAVSGWRLARTVSQLGQMGVVSGTALDTVNVRRLQLGDPGGYIRRALDHFPWPKSAKRFLENYYIPGGKSTDKPFKLLAKPAAHMNRTAIENIIVANFIEVFLAKEGHDGLIGINYLEKIQLPTLPSLFGAMLAGVDFVLMGGGLPLAIPEILDGLSRLEPVELKLHVEGNGVCDDHSQQFAPKDYCPGTLPSLERPKFLAIISSNTAAKTMIRRASGHVDGFVVEHHIAGGHNAPPRKVNGPPTQSTPEYGQKDIIDIEQIRKMDRPFWIAGGCASPSALKEALAAGANGIQVGTAFAFCRQSGTLPEIKDEVIGRYRDGHLDVCTDFLASPTGYPFKLIPPRSEPGTTGKENKRKLCCDLGYLRHMYLDGDNEIAYRCPAEPIKSFLKKGGCREQTLGKQCLCNGLLATIGLGQARDDSSERPMLTSGEDFSFLSHVLKNGTTDYSARDVIEYLHPPPLDPVSLEFESSLMLPP